MPNNKLAKTEREELSGLSATELKEKLEETRKQLWSDKFAQGKRALTNTAALSKSRKRIARIQMYLSQKESIN
jgi:large subunit ribosomal protein L29